MAKSKTCSHIKVNGKLCQAVALKGDNYCYFHRDARQRYKRQARSARHYEPLVLPLLEDRESIQICLHEVMLAIVKQRIDTKQAGLLLYALQIATKNAVHDLDFEAEMADEVATEYNYDEEASLEREVEQDREAELDTLSNKHAELRAAQRARDEAQHKLDAELQKVLPPKKPVKDDTFWIEMSERADQKLNTSQEEKRKAKA